MRVYTH